MRLLSSIFSGQSEKAHVDHDVSVVVTQTEEAISGADDDNAQIDAMYWHPTKRYDPAAANAAEHELEPSKPRVEQAVPTPMPMVSSEKAYNMGTANSIASLCVLECNYTTTAASRANLAAVRCVFCTSDLHKSIQPWLKTQKVDLGCMMTMTHCCAPALP